MDEKKTNPMTALAREKHNLMTEYLAITREQTEIIKSHTYDLMLGLLNQKQHIIEQINMLDSQQQSYNSGDNEPAHLMNRQTGELIAKIRELDRKNMQVLQREQAQVFEKLKSAKQNTKAHYLYLGIGQTPKGVIVDQEK
jgi:FlgN protein.